MKNNLLEMTDFGVFSSQKKDRKLIRKVLKYGCIIFIIGSAYYMFSIPSAHAAQLLKEKRDTFILDNVEYQQLYKTFDFRDIKKTSIPLKGIGRVLGHAKKIRINDINTITKDITLDFPEKLKSLQVKPIINSIRTVKTRKLVFLKGGASALLISSIINSIASKESFIKKINDKPLDEKEMDNSDLLPNKRTILINKLKNFVPYLYNFRTPVPYVVAGVVGGALIYFNREKIASYIDILALKVAHYLDLDFGPDEPDFPIVEDPYIYYLKKDENDSDDF